MKTVILSFASTSLIYYQKNWNSSLNIPSRELNLIEDHNEFNKTIHYDIEKEKDICPKSSKYSDDKFNKNAITDKIKLIRVIVVTLMVPQTSTNVVKMASEEKKITR